MPQRDPRQNPFPGMNPYMEMVWGDVHTRMLAAIADTLAGELPNDLTARAEERVEMIESGTDGTVRRYPYRVDVAISERWREGLPPVWHPDDEKAAEVAVMEPEFVACEAAEDIQRWLEVRDRDGLVVTVLEVLSPANKDRKKREYRERRQRFMETGANFVEVDLLRGGAVTVMAIPRISEGVAPTPYVVAVYRAAQPERFEVYGCGLRDRLPCFRVPLRAKDLDVPLDLQPLLDRIYVTGRYWLHDYAAPLIPPLSADEQTWSRERLAEAGLV